MSNILLPLIKFKSIWDLLRETPIIFDNINWVMIINHLIPLFRKDTFFNMVGTEKYYPQPTLNCRYYIKPNDGSCGKGIQITYDIPLPIEGYTICPEVISPLMKIDGKGFKYDYRVWVGICSNLEYFICQTLILRRSNIPFSLDSTFGSLTNTALYADQFDHQNIELYNKINLIVKNVLDHLSPSTDEEHNIMLTGWDFIENESNELFVLEVNCNPAINIQHQQIMTEFLNSIHIIDSKFN